jgi:hypothetical protein
VPWDREDNRHVLQVYCTPYTIHHTLYTIYTIHFALIHSYTHTLIHHTPYTKHQTLTSRVLQDGRTFVVGLSDDAGGGNHLGFATRVGIGGGVPLQDEVTRIDDYIRYTLYGPKPKGPQGKPYPWLADPHFQLQEAANDRILMTVL